MKNNGKTKIKKAGKTVATAIAISASALFGVADTVCNTVEVSASTETRPTLRRGSRGEDVTYLQMLLGVEADGIFGKDTEAAVRRFQSENSLEVDGIVGKKTWSKLLNAPTGKFLGTYKFKNKETGYVINIEGDSKYEGANLIISDDNGDSGNYFDVYSTDQRGYYNFFNDGQYVTVSANVADNNINLQMGKDGNSDAAKFCFDDAGEEYVYIAPWLDRSFCFDAERIDGTVSNHSNLQIYKNEGGIEDNRKWLMQKVYNADHALEYAKGHWDDNKGKCAEFVSACLKAGGCDVSHPRCLELREQLLACGMGEEFIVTANSDGTVIDSRIVPGDILFFECPGSDHYGDGRKYVHTVIVSGTDSNGCVKAFSHNGANSGKKAYSYKKCGYCGTTITDVRVYHFYK